VLAYITRERDGRRELLVFDQPHNPERGTQVPAGRLEQGEQLVPGLLREVEEEAGLSDVRVVRKLGTYAAGELPHGSRYTNHAYELEAPGAPDAWEHVVVGEGDDAGLGFRYRWEPLTPELVLWGSPDPILRELD
jgi:8-oxo-dGTP pyrophosphatase MutT (NUDIX family)